MYSKSTITTHVSADMHRFAARLRTFVLNSRTENVRRIRAVITSLRAYSEIAITAICLISLLPILGCASIEPNPARQPSMPPCVIQGERGVWISTNGGESYRCVHRAVFENWWKWVNL
jgi:hypothetical protein